jgi:pyrroloquinoline quinone biosynthesis protein B
MQQFLAHNRPWSHLVTRGEITLEPVQPGEPLDFDGVEVHAFLTPHRGEDTDTIGLEFRGPRRRVVFVSDADFFPDPLVERIREADLALVDGTFYDADELPHRDISKVRHPFVRESVERLAGGRGEVRFIHLNHTNALLHPDPARVPALPAGFGVAREGDEIAL